MERAVICPDAVRARSDFTNVVSMWQPPGINRTPVPSSNLTSRSPQRPNASFRSGASAASPIGATPSTWHRYRVNE